MIEYILITSTIINSFILGVCAEEIKKDFKRTVSQIIIAWVILLFGWVLVIIVEVGVKNNTDKK